MQIVGITEAAKAIGVKHPTLVQYLQRHPDLRLEDGKVDLVALREHRAANLNKAKQRSHAGQLLGEPSPSRGPSYAESKAELAREQAREAKRKNALAEEALVAASEVKAIGFEVAKLFETELVLRNDALADQLAGMTDPRAIVKLLHEADRKLREAVAAKAAELVAGHDDDRAAA